MELQRYIIKVWQNILVIVVLHDLFYEILLLKPSPRLIYLPQILHQQLILLDTSLRLADYTHSLCMSSECFPIWIKL